MLQSVQSPTHLSHITLSQPFRITCERYIFLKKCVRSSLLLILFPHVYIYMVVYILRQYSTWKQWKCYPKSPRLVIRLFNVISRTYIVGVFYSCSRLVFARERYSTPHPQRLELKPYHPMQFDVITRIPLLLFFWRERESINPLERIKSVYSKPHRNAIDYFWMI